MEESFQQIIIKALKEGLYDAKTLERLLGIERDSNGNISKIYSNTQVFGIMSLEKYNEMPINPQMIKEATLSYTINNEQQQKVFNLLSEINSFVVTQCKNFQQEFLHIGIPPELIPEIAQLTGLAHNNNWAMKILTEKNLIQQNSNESSSSIAK